MSILWAGLSLSLHSEDTVRLSMMHEHVAKDLYQKKVVSSLKKLAS